jgi:nicotinate-nucleotide adenylyltransferase
MISGTGKTGLFFGSFNPIHLGHLMIAGYMVEFTDLSQVWFIISPHNPLKERSALLPDVNRLYMVNVAVEEEARFKASNIEFHLPRPSYTIDTMTYLGEQYPGREFVLIAGSDTLPTLHKWKNHEELLRQYHFYVYPRPGTAESPFDHYPSVHFVPAPLIEISSSFIREAIRQGKDPHYFLPGKVWKYIDDMGFYR